jgi:hypothetical protein
MKASFVKPMLPLAATPFARVAGELWIIAIGEYMANIANPHSFLSILSDHPDSPNFAPLAVPALGVCPQGFRRGAITEIVGRRSSGRMTATLHILAQATARGGGVCRGGYK